MSEIAVTPDFPLPQLRQPIPPVPREGAGPGFASLLHADRPPAEIAPPFPRESDRRPRETVPFAALGMFGFDRAAAGGDPPPAARAGEREELGAPVEPARAQEDPAHAALHGPRNAREPQPQRPAAPAGAERPARGSAAPADRAPPTAAEAPDRFEGAPLEPGTEPPERAPPPEPRPREYRSAQGPVLSVAGADDALKIVVRAQDETPEGRARLRRLIEQAAAEFGATVAELHLNGSPAEPTPGGIHGTRSR
jgi:hypothetical protein